MVRACSVGTNVCVTDGDTAVTLTAEQADQLREAIRQLYRYDCVTLHDIDLTRSDLPELVNAAAEQAAAIDAEHAESPITKGATV